MVSDGLSYIFIIRLVGCGETVMFITETSGQLVKVHTVHLTDEVNSIDVNDKLTYAAVADDSGLVTIIDLKTYKIHKVSNYRHCSITIYNKTLNLV